MVVPPVLFPLQEDGRLVLTCRKPFDDKNAMAKFNVGDVLLGTVRQIQPYGAFVEAAGNIQGLLHISQISNERVMSMDGIFTVGDKIKVMVLTKETVDGKSKLGLTTRKLEPNPGDMLRNPKLVFDKARRIAARSLARSSSLLLVCFRLQRALPVEEHRA